MAEVAASLPNAFFAAQIVIQVFMLGVELRPVGNIRVTGFQFPDFLTIMQLLV
jgi:hypothetical protein